MPILDRAAAETLSREERWPALPHDAWAETRETLHMWTQIVGKLNVELAPFQNQLWHTALHLTARGLTTRPLPYGGSVFQVDFDFVDHNLAIDTGEGARKLMPLYPRSVAHFYDELMSCLRALGIDVRINTTPQEVPNPVPFEEDTIHASYDPHAVDRWWRIVTSTSQVMWEHRAWFRGKASPVHWYWGSFDLTATRHNGEPAAPPPGGGYIYRVAEDEKNWAAGFWPGSGSIDYPAFYAYMYPQPDGLAEAALAPEAAFWSAEMREFLLPYDAVRAADDPEAALMDFLQSTYVVSADLAGWDRERLELKEIPKPR
jgi:Family of unknown function (DUF5996)